MSKKTWTLNGLIDMYLLIFIHVGSRRVWISSATAHPDSAWVAQQARNVCMEFAEEKQMPTDLIHDADTIFTAQFDEIFKAEGVRVKKLLPRCPNMNAYVERFVQTLGQECLDHFVVLGEKHLNHIVSEFLRHYHEERPHQGIGNVPVSGMAEHKGDGSEIICREQIDSLDVTVYENAGLARFVDPKTIETASGLRLQSDKIILCTGGISRHLDVPGFEFTNTHSDAWSLTSVPPSMLVIGGGATGRRSLRFSTLLARECNCSNAVRVFCRPKTRIFRPPLQPHSATRGLRFRRVSARSHRSRKHQPAFA